MNGGFPKHAAVLETGTSSGVLLVLSQTEETSRRIESFLRNAGHPLRTAWLTDLEDLEDALRRNPPDLVLCEVGLPKVPYARVLSLCADLRPELPVLLIGEADSLEVRGNALAAGAHDYLAYGDLLGLRHLELAIVREFIKHRQLQKLRLTEERLADFASRHQQLTQSTADAVAYVQEGIVTQANVAFASMLGHDSPADLPGLPLIDLVVEAQRTKIKERLRAVQKGKHNGDPLELDLIGRQGTIQVKAQLILGNVDGESVIELLIRGVAKAEAAAPLPQSKNRSDFASVISVPAVTPTAGPRTAILIRIDGFAALEARIGHADAEEVISKLTVSVHARLQPEDLSFAFSTDEIALLIQRQHLDDVEEFCERLRKEIAGDIFATRHNEAHATISIAAHPLAGDEQPSIVIRDLAERVRALSAETGNQFAMVGAAAKAGQNERDESRRAEQVKAAIESGRLKLAYQSIASLEGDTRPHFDVLVRMVDETGKEYHAGEFLPAAQKFNLMPSIDRWVIGRAYSVIAKRAAGSEPKTLFVKISEETLKDADNFIAWLRPMAERRDKNGDDVIFQVREGIVQNHMRKSKLLVQALAGMKVRLALEHFGLNPNSGQLLDHIDVAFIKFHPTFTEKFSNREIQKRLGELMDIAKVKQIKTIVSHVEDANVMARLWQMGVNYVQGYHVQEPEVVFLTSEARH